MRSLLFAAGITIALTTPSAAFAYPDCWEVTGWTSTPLPNTSSPGPSFERAMVAPASCTISPHQQLWVAVNQASGGAVVPQDLWVLVDRHDPWRTEGLSPAQTSSSLTLYGGLVYRGSFAGVIPDLWRPLSGGTDEPLERKSPIAAAPTDGATVMFELDGNGRGLYHPFGQGSLEWGMGGITPRSPFTTQDNFSTGFPGWDPGNWWSTGMAFVIQYAGTNMVGEDEWHIRDATNDGWCLAKYPSTTFVSPWVQNCASSTPDAWVIEASPTPGRVWLRHAASGLCLRMASSAMSVGAGFGARNAADSDVVMTTLEKGIPLPSDDDDDTGLDPGPCCVVSTYE